MIRTKIEERTVGNIVRFYPMVEKKGLFSRKNKWVEFTQLKGNAFDEWEEVVYFDTLRGAKGFLDNYLINKGQCEKITHWYPEYGEEDKEMSTVERNKGTLKEVAVREIIDQGLDLNDLYDTGYMRLKDKYYKVEYAVESEEDCSYFAEITKCPYTTENVYHFHTLHYSGGGSLEEVLEGVLE